MKIRHAVNDLQGGSPVRHPPIPWRRYVPAVAGVAGIATSVVVADVVAIKTRRPTISAAVATAMEHDWLAPLVLGTAAGLTWHLIAHPIVHRLANR